MSNHEPSVGERIISSTLWVGAWRWTARLIGFVSIIILARLLLPADFGIVATGMVVVAFFDILTDLGTDRYLIRLPDPEREDYDSAWTLRLIVISGASAAIFLLASPAAAFYGDARLVSVLQVLALANALRGFTNIGLTIYQRDLQFQKIALVGITQRIIGTCATITLAFWLNSYWAMVIGEVVLRLAELVLSYKIHAYRPRLTLTRFTKQWLFCRWMLVSNIAKFIQRQGDNLVVAKFFGIEPIGVYSIAMRFASLPTRELINPMLAPMYSGLATKQGDNTQFNNNTLTIISMTSLILLPAATLFISLAEPLVMTILGAKWQMAVPLIPPLTLAITAMMLCNPISVALTLKGHVRLLAALNWLSAISMLSAMVMIALSGTLEQLAYARAGVAVIIAALYYACMCRILHLPVGQLFAALYRPLFAALGMGFVTSSLAASALAAWQTIALSIVLGFALYCIFLFGLWYITKAPAAAEAVLVSKLLKLIGRTTKAANR